MCRLAALLYLSLSACRMSGLLHKEVTVQLGFRSRASFDAAPVDVDRRRMTSNVDGLSDTHGVEQSKPDAGFISPP